MGLSSTPRRQHTPKKELSESHSQTPDTTMNTSKRNMLWSDSLTPICSRKTMGIVVSMLATTVVANFFMNLQTPITLLDIGRNSGLVSARHGVVSTEHPICSQIGVQVLRENGTAVDAAVASSLCIVEKAPAAATTNMFADDPMKAQTGGLAVAVPHGRLPWRRLVQPAVDLVRDGWVVNAILEQRMQVVRDLILTNPDFSKDFAPDGELLRTGQIIKRPNLARTLDAIATEGIDVFYRGWIAEALVKVTQETGGILTMADMAAYHPTVGSPMIGSFRGKRVITSPPPTSGPVLLSVLNLLEGYDLSSPSSPLNAHLLVESWKYGYAQRSYYGDPSDPIYRNISEIANRNIDKATSDHIRQGIFPDRTFEPGHYAAAYDVLNDHGTMHLSILTEQGEAVSLTSTMDDFSIPGVSNAFGLASSPYNYIRPGKRPMSSSVPTIIESADGSHVEIVAGASGGSMIITSTMQTILGMTEFGYDPAAAIHMPRMHHQLLPNTLVLEFEFDRHVAREIQTRGHTVVFFNEGEYRTGVQAIKRLPDGTLQAASDFRKGGVAAGY
ncbi:gamma-glutamyltransferase [Batrachochytrium salamandrivorans]|nr:gamma-glutamyltransferase [Batrachochytrium salamandrivorans]